MIYTVIFFKKILDLNHFLWYNGVTSLKVFISEGFFSVCYFIDKCENCRENFTEKEGGRPDLVPVNIFRKTEVPS